MSGTPGFRVSYLVAPTVEHHERWCSKRVAQPVPGHKQPTPTEHGIGMGYIGTNIVPILAATLAGLIVGAAFLRLVRTDRAEGFGVGAAVIAVLAEFWLAAILAGALILAPSAQAGPWVMALGSAVVIWIGFVLPTQVVSALARNHRPGIIVIDCAHWLVVMLLQAAVLQTIGLTHP